MNHQIEADSLDSNSAGAHRTIELNMVYLELQSGALVEYFIMELGVIA